MEKTYSIFISPKNQTLLWKTINKSTLFNQLPPNERAEWFKNIIGYIYYEKNTFFFDTDELVTLNKKTIHFILNELNTTIEKRRMEKIDNNSYFTNVPNNHSHTVISSTEVLQPNIELKEQYENEPFIKKEMYNKNNALFDIKQKEFNELISNNTPPQIDFRIKEIDEPVEDLNVLIERCVKERNEFIGQSYGEVVVQP